MIKKITLENFKAFKNAEIEIKPITILVGPNNGGKSSLLQSIGLIKQTLGGSNEVLSFRGSLQNFGDYDNIVHQDSASNDMRLRFDFEEGTFFDIRVCKEILGKVFVKDFSCNDGKFEYILENIEEKKGKLKEESAYYKPKNFKLIDVKIQRQFEGIHPIFYRENFFFKIRNLFESPETIDEIMKDLT